MEGYWRDAPKARPLHRAFFFLRKTAAGFLRLLIHLGQNAGVQIALIERGFASTHHGGHDPRKRFETTHGANRIGVFVGNIANVEGEFGCGCQRVTTRIHRSGTGVGLLAEESNVVALDAFGA